MTARWTASCAACTRAICTKRSPPPFAATRIPCRYSRCARSSPSRRTASGSAAALPAVPPRRWRWCGAASSPVCLTRSCTYTRLFASCWLKVPASCVICPIPFAILCTRPSGTSTARWKSCAGSCGFRIATACWARRSSRKTGYCPCCAATSASGTPTSVSLFMTVPTGSCCCTPTDAPAYRRSIASSPLCPRAKSCTTGRSGSSFSRA